MCNANLPVLQKIAFKRLFPPSLIDPSVIRRCLPGLGISFRSTVWPLYVFHSIIAPAVERRVAPVALSPNSPDNHSVCDSSFSTSELHLCSPRFCSSAICFHLSSLTISRLSWQIGIAHTLQKYVNKKIGRIEQNRSLRVGAKQNRYKNQLHECEIQQQEIVRKNW